CGGDGAGTGVVVQSSRANTKTAKSTSRASSSRRSRVVVPGLKDVVQGSTWPTSSRPRVSAWSNFPCLPDEPRKMRGLSIPSSRRQLPSIVHESSRGGQLVPAPLQPGDREFQAQANRIVRGETPSPQGEEG